MNPNTGLLAASELVTFLLRTTIEWLICLLLVQMAKSAKVRFNLWLTLLTAFVAQWLWMGVEIFKCLLPAHSTKPVSQDATASAAAVFAEHVAIVPATAELVSRAMVLCLVCYVAVFAWGVLGSLAARSRLLDAMRFKEAPDDRLAECFANAIRQRQMNCELWVLPGLPSPATVGWWKPQVIVPPLCAFQDASELDAVFWHELKHVERRDVLWNTVAFGCSKFLWFHPCVHHVAHLLRAERELACDAAVVAEHPLSRDVYASCLVRFARNRDIETQPSTTGIEMVSSSGLLAIRVRKILEEANVPNPESQAWRLVASSLLIGLMTLTVPVFNILFAEEAVAPSIRLLAMKSRPHAPNNTIKSPTKIPNLANKSGAIVSQTVSAMRIEHDEDLAAEHRTAMNIVTESTGMDDPSSPDSERDDDSVKGGTPTQRTGVQAVPSWAAIAVDAAVRIGPLMNDHDSDDRR